MLDKSLIITEKPSVARQFAAALGVIGNQDGYIEDDKWVITWCIGHLVSLSYPEAYDPALKKWSMDGGCGKTDRRRGAARADQGQRDRDLSDQGRNHYKAGA